MKNPNIEKLSYGWIYKKRSYGYFNTMRANIVELILDPRLEELCHYMVHNKKPKLNTRPSKQEIMVQMSSKHKVNDDQFKAIMRTL